MIRRLISYGTVFSILSISAFAAGVDASSDGSAVLEIDGKKISLSEFEQKQPTALLKARNSFYDAEKTALYAYIDQYLLEQQAKKENLTVDQLLDKHVNSTIEKDPSDEALEVYYEGLNSKDSFDKVRGQILEHVRQIRIDKAKATYLKSLHEQSKVTLLITPPRAITASTKDQAAAVTVIEYADYECPYCQQEEPIIQKIQSEFKGKVAFIYKDTPLPMHPHAEKAAEAARCAGAQGKFWEYHDQLFQTKQLELAQLKSLAQTMKLDTEAFDKCLDSGQFSAMIKDQLTEASALQVEGTPSFLVNGRFIGGGMNYEDFKKLVDEEINNAGKPGDTATR